MKKIWQATIISILGIALLACNASETGFNAPNGAAVTFLTSAVDLTFGGPGEILVLITLQVLSPDGSQGTQPGKEISGSIICAYCNLYVFKEGVTTFLPQTSLVDPVAANSFVFTTNNQGLYRFVVGIQSPVDLGFVDSEGSLIGYEDSLIADIGVAQTTLSLAANPAE